MTETEIRIPIGPRTTLDGSLIIPHGANSIVIFAHGSGSSRHSPRNKYVAKELQSAGLGTLLMDLLTPGEETIDLRTRHLRFDIGLLAERLVGAADWLKKQPNTARMKLGLFGASTGGGAALVAAAEKPDFFQAVVSRGGRPDLAGNYLPEVKCPTLLIVGGNDHAVIGMNKEAMDKMKSEVRLEIVPGATHLFEEPGTLEKVAEIARDFFSRVMGPTAH